MTGLVGWYPLHETNAGQVCDLSGNGNHGSLNGGITWGLAGKSGLTAYGFDGSNGWVDVPSANQYSRITVSVWVYLRDATGIQDFVSTNNGSGQGWLMTLRDSDRFRWYWGDGSSYNNIGTTTPSTGQWYHLVGTYDGTHSKLYINGSLDDQTTAPNLAPQSGSNTGIGANFTGNRPSNAIITDVRIYNRALTPLEVQKLYLQGTEDYHQKSLSDGSDSAAVSRWRFNNSNNNTGEAVDYWGSNHGTVSGATFRQEEGVRGGAYEFDGTSQYITASTNGMSKDVGTFSAWVNYNSLSANAALARIRNDESNRYLFGYGDGGSTIRFFTEIGGSGNSILSTSFNSERANAWHHITISYDFANNQHYLYLNGTIADQSQNSFNALSSLPSSIEIGKYDFGGSTYTIDGLIDDVRTYNRALKHWEVFELYRWGTKGIDMRKKLVNARGNQQ